MYGCSVSSLAVNLCIFEVKNSKNIYFVWMLVYLIGWLVVYFLPGVAVVTVVLLLRPEYCKAAIDRPS